MPKYTDLNLAVNKKHPITGDIGRLYDATAINNAIKNLLFTKKGTIPHNRFKGTNLWKLLGELNTAVTRHLIKTEIQQTIIDHEPRVRLLDVKVESDTVNENQVNIGIYYLILAVSQQSQLELSLSLNR